MKNFDPGTAKITDQKTVVMHGLDLPKKPGKKKYHNKLCLVDGEWFHSKKEANRWQELRVMEMAGHIKDLRRQVRYPLVVKGMKVSVYTADFVYFDNRAGREVVEDTKSEATSQDRSYGIRKRLMKAIYGIEILET